MSESILDRVRSTCAAVVQDPLCCVRVDSSALDRFVSSSSSFTEAAFDALARPTRLPLRFDTLDQELNLHCVLALLNFGHGFRRELHAAVDRGAWESVLVGVMSMHVAGAALDARFFEALTESDVAEHFQLPIMTDRPHESIPGLAISSPSVLRPFIALVQTVLRDTGARLRQLGYQRLSQFVLDTLKPSSAASATSTAAGPSAAVLVERLVQCFPAFEDCSVFNGHRVLFLKKAQFLASEVYTLFGTRDPERFAFKDVDQLTVFVDNVVPAVLRQLGILVLAPELCTMIDSHVDLSTTRRVEGSAPIVELAGGKSLQDADVQLRAAAVSACEEIVALARQRHPWAATLNAKRLDYYLWRLGKEPGYRTVTRHKDQTTFYY
ncbi:hypothetical protein CAOG_008199 [Capsaspora owczarzaki ATCC 30864]|uniref:Queuosine 5'-phosphate N-glycosylase/hydrolase n=2 Tax=Capsaspora owczarzaki (strain ATCC 30864) TaxID=595528 RepID=A0A0D2UTA1_CAPO3|nr:hypothetical protein CAOG_008199 [Capsaspora owczarzaki ATCC 30864]